MSAQSQSQQIKQNFLNHPYTQQATKFVSGQVNALDAELNRYPMLRDLEAKTKVPKAYGVLALGASSVVLIFFNMFGLAQPVSNLIGWVLPAYLSVQAIESPGTDDDKQWLTYWTVFGGMNLLESIAVRPILYWVPMYFVFKTVLIIWLMLPATRGAEVVYHNVVRPLVGQAKARPAATNPFNKPEGYTTAAPSSFERESASLCD
ncbi:Protein YOP1 [Saitozyma sp. JCM 24511]|nr:Protein YOP1 [Saitozyma sp. JCM 24511]